MGLDQWLYCNSKKVCEEVNDITDEYEAEQAKNGIAIRWRKANMIHKWFVDNVQGGNDDCDKYDVDISKLVRLHDTCKEVLDSTRLVVGEIENGRIMKANGEWVPNIVVGQKLEDDSVARELLPTCDGFFFGETEYNQWYWWDLEYTVEKLEKIIDCLVPAGAKGWHVAHKDEPDWYVKFDYVSNW